MASEEVKVELAAGLKANPDKPVFWLPDVWADWVPVEAVPEELRGSITKEQLYLLGDKLTVGGSDRDVAGFIIAVQAWGAGIAGKGGDGRGPWRAAGALGLPDRSPDAPLATHRIAAARRAIDLSRCDSPAAWRFLYRGTGHLPRWGESFFTKFMHVAGYGHGDQPWPLILDEVVRGRLKDVGLSLGRGKAAYKTYLKVAHQWAADWGVPPARVEYALFHRPKH